MNIKSINQITPAQIAALTSAGYQIEDMGQEHGSDFIGQYRWLKGDDFQDFEPSYSPECAWACALDHSQAVRGVTC